MLTLEQPNFKLSKIAKCFENQVIDPRRTIFYFGFSYTINVAMGATDSKGRSKLLDAISAVPDDRIIVESDEVGDDEISLSSEPILDAAMNRRAVVATQLAVELVAEAKSWSVDHAAKITSENGIRFLTSHLRSEIAPIQRDISIYLPPTINDDFSASLFEKSRIQQPSLLSPLLAESIQSPVKSKSSLALLEGGNPTVGDIIVVWDLETTGLSVFP